jgi:LuxR family maltose regulon positive regulatory protein
MDNDVRMFLRYVVAAVRTVYPEACAETAIELKADRLSPLPVLAGHLGNDLDEIEESFVLVLDDYQSIRDKSVHELLNHLLRHPPSLNLVIISRRDPPLFLGALRAHNNLVEIRMQDLKFTLAETEAFFNQIGGQTISSAALASLHQNIEGWVTGLRLAAQALPSHGDADAFVSGFSGETHAVIEFLVEEVLENQLPVTRECLYRTSVLNRVCAPLCSAVCTSCRSEAEKTLCSQDLMRYLGSSDLFSVALDESGDWYRYNHLFQKFLRRKLKGWLTQDEIIGMHRRAASWFEARGLLEEAIDHVLQADGPVAAGRLIVRQRNEILNGEQWHGFERWLNRLPAEALADDPDLLILRAWHLFTQGRNGDASVVLERIDELMSSEPWSSAATPRLRGSIDILRAYHCYQKGQADPAMKCAKRALTELPPDCLSERGYALNVLGEATRMNGDLERARKIIYRALTDAPSQAGIFQCRMLLTLCRMNWAAADLRSTRLTANRYLELSTEHGLSVSSMNARYFLGAVQYHRNELSAAETSLVPVVFDRGASNSQYFTHSVFALAAVYQARGQTDKARETVASACEYLMSVQNIPLLQRVLAYQADLALRQGHLADALSWAHHFDPKSFEGMCRFYEPRATLARVLIAEGGADSRMRADGLLTRLETAAAGTNNVRLLIEVYILQAVLHDAQGNEPAARSVLSMAVRLAEPGGFTRLFVDLGPGLAGLLNCLDLDAEEQRYVGQILNVFAGDGQTKMGGAIDHGLTKRELEILQLLANELSNRHIADRLCISLSTVKRHAENIYHKLAVPDRHKAVSKAIGLAIIRSD